MPGATAAPLAGAAAARSAMQAARRYLMLDLRRKIRLVSRRPRHGLPFGTREQVERNAVRDHQRGHVQDRYRISGAQLTGNLRKIEYRPVIVVDEDVDRPDDVECDEERIEKGGDPERHERKQRQHAGGEVPVGREGGEGRREVWAYHAGQDENQPEEPEAVERRNRAKHAEAIHKLHLRQHVGREQQAPREVPESCLSEKDDLRRHRSSPSLKWYPQVPARHLWYYLVPQVVKGGYSERGSG